MFFGQLIHLDFGCNGEKHLSKMLMTTTTTLLLIPIFLYFTLLLKNCVLPSLLPPFSSPSKKIQYLSYLSSLNYEQLRKKIIIHLCIQQLWKARKRANFKVCINLFPLKKNIPSDEQNSRVVKGFFFENVTTLISMLPFLKNCLKIIG